MNLNLLKDKYKNSLSELIQKYKKLFGGTLGKYTGSDYTIDLQENVKPYHAKPFPIPNNNKPIFKTEVDR